MSNEYSLIQKTRFFSNIALLYVLSIAFILYALRPMHLLAQSRPVSFIQTSQTPHLSVVPKITLVSGQPVRIVIPASSVDLPIDPGYYNSSDDSWTLSGYRAQFAMVSTLANNIGGETFIYGHNNNYVFGALRHVTPSPGASALLYTDNGHIFAYSFQSASSLAPDDSSALNYQGPPMLTVQTCTGSFNEWRTVFKFSFVKVMQ